MNFVCLVLHSGELCLVLHFGEFCLLLHFGEHDSCKFFEVVLESFLRCQFDVDLLWTCGVSLMLISCGPVVNMMTQVWKIVFIICLIILYYIILY